MVPVLLKLSNFTSYGSDVPELDFTKFHMAAISGPNGAGKSSLLDAITWCVWGTSRLGDSSDQLVRLGQGVMFVEFSFQLDGHVYTVKRQRVLKGGGSTTLELLSNAHNLTEGTIKATQQKIIDTLHLTYETFTNSAFLRQGHADEFTTRGATDRKRILADILGLAHYDALEEKAKEKGKEAQTKIQLLEYQLLEIEAELSQKQEREKALSEAEKEAEEAEKQLKEVGQRIKLIETEEKVISTKLKSLEETGERIRVAQKELEDLKLQISLKEKGQAEYQEILKKQREIEENYRKLKGLEEQKKALDGKRSELIQVKDELAALQKVIFERDNKRNQAITDLQIQIKKIQTEAEQLEEQNKHLRDHKDTCPTCGQAIGAKKNSEIIKKNNAAIKEYEDNLQELAGKLKKYQSFVFPESAQAKEKEAAVEKLEDETREYQNLNQKISSLSVYENFYLKLQQAETAVQAHQEGVSDLQKIYRAKGDQVKKEEQTLEGLEKQQRELLEIKNKLQAEESIKEELSQKALALRGIVGEAKQLVSRAKQLEDLLEKRKEEKKKLQTEKDAFEELTLAFGKKGIQAMIIETAIPEIEEESNRLLEKLTEGRMKVYLETQRETKTKVGGEYGTIETLDIIISDEMGERPYEAYSVAGDELVYVRQNGHIRSLPIQELWSIQKPTEIDGDYQFQEADVEALCYTQGKVSWQKVDKILRHKSPKKILEIKACPGNYTVKLTKNHSIYVLTPDGIKVKRTEDLVKGDFLLSPKIIPSGKSISKIDFTNYISSEFLSQRDINHKSLKFDYEFIWSRSDQKINRFTPLGQDFAKLMGLVVAEGSGKVDYSIAAGSNPSLAGEATLLASQAFGNPQRTLGFVSEEQMKNYIGKAPGISSQHPQTQYRPKIGGRLVAEIMKNMVGGGATMKKVPDYVFNATQEVQRAFLKGLILGDGHIILNKNQSKSEVCITTVSRQLTGELVFLYRQLGIWARIENHGNAGFRRGMSHQKSYRIVISGKGNLEILGIGELVSSYDTTTKYEGIPYSLIGTVRKNGPRNNKRFPRDVENQTFNCGVQKIPYTAKEKYLKVQEMIKDWNILEVEEVREIESSSEYVYDLMVPGNNSFVAGNGALLVHNSGGEQFRVNFAIRLALSKLLTHRAGAKLQLLVVDEGFGTQDAEGRARIVEAINAIKNDFEKILIITHLEELKEEFPVRIEVSKGPVGSTFEVVGT